METQEQYLPAKQDPSQLIALALDKGADPEILKKLMDLQERWEAGQARKAYVVAMTAFKQEAPAVLKKQDKVDFTSSRGRTAYNYANLGSIVQEISALLGKHELSASWGTDQQNNRVVVTCNITHSAGHRESVTLNGPIDDSGNKNPIQAVGSTVTYLQRYTLLAALGLATVEDDDDGRQGAGKTGQGKPPVATPQRKSEAKTEPVDSDLKDKLTMALAELIELRGLTSAEILNEHSKFTDKENKERFCDNLDDLFKSKKWPGSVYRKITEEIADIKKSRGIGQEDPFPESPESQGA